MPVRTVQSNKPHPQHRAAARYKLRLPVIFHWNHDGSEQTEGGFTLDVALNGVFICSSRCPALGSDIRIEVLLPSPYQTGEELRIQCTGKVTRVVSENTLTGFGVVGGFDDDHLTRKAHNNSPEYFPQVIRHGNQWG